MSSIGNNLSNNTVSFTDPSVNTASLAESQASQALVLAQQNMSRLSQVITSVGELTGQLNLANSQFESSRALLQAARRCSELSRTQLNAALIRSNVAGIQLQEMMKQERAANETIIQEFQAASIGLNTVAQVHEQTTSTLQVFEQAFEIANQSRESAQQEYSTAIMELQMVHETAQNELRRSFEFAELARNARARVESYMGLLPSQVGTKN